MRSVGPRPFAWAAALILLVSGPSVGLALLPPGHLEGPTAAPEPGLPPPAEAIASAAQGAGALFSWSGARGTGAGPDPLALRTTGAGNSTPPGAPNITGIATGPGRITLHWSAPAGTATVTGYVIEWGFEGGAQGNQTAAPSNRSALILGLIAFAHYHVNVTAFNGSAAGPPSASFPFLLYGWTLVRGTVSPATASVWIDSLPVSVADGVYAENTSLVPHQVSASATNYRTADLVALPIWNGTSWANLSLALLPGTIEGYVAPVTSLVTWNATTEPVNGNGFYDFPVPPATLGTFAVAYPGLVTFQRTLSVEANATLWQNVTLAAPNASLTLHLHPAGASVSIDRELVAIDAQGNATVSLEAGTHSLEATHVDYYAYFANVTLISGQVEVLILNLTKIANTTGPNGTAEQGSALSDPIVQALLVGVAILGVAVVVLGRRGRAPEAPRARGQDEYGSDETSAVDAPDGAGPGPPTN